MNPPNQQSETPQEVLKAINYIDEFIGPRSSMEPLYFKQITDYLSYLQTELTAAKAEVEEIGIKCAEHETKYQTLKLEFESLKQDRDNLKEENAVLKSQVENANVNWEQQNQLVKVAQKDRDNWRKLAETLHNQFCDGHKKWCNTEFKRACNCGWDIISQNFTQLTQRKEGE